MHNPTEDQQTEPAPPAPLHLRCTGCGVDANAPDRAFTPGPIALVSHAHHALISLRCETCEMDNDLALWTIDQQRFISEGGPDAFHPGDPRAIALVERYEQLVQEYRRATEGQYEQRERWPVVDLSGAYVEIQPDRFFFPPMASLAAARGLRQAIAAHQSAQPPGIVLLGDYKCILSLDETPQAPHPYTLHLSVSNAVLPGCLPDYQLRWLVSLFFTPGEVPFLLVQPGHRVPVIHFYLPAYAPDLNPC
jgi:hypothetical protein